MKFIEKVARMAAKEAGEMQVEAVYIGVSYVVAVLENQECGMAFVFRNSLPCGCNVSLPKRPLAGSSVAELTDFAGHSLLGNAIALAVANAVLNPLCKTDTSGDLVEQLEIEPGMKVGMVGFFKPLEPIIKGKGAELLIFDQQPDLFPGIHSPEEIPEMLPDCDIAILTGTSIINETFDDLINHVNSSQVAVLGASTPLYPPCYKGTPVTCAAGIKVKDRQAVINSIIEAGGQKVFGRYVEKVNIML